MITCTAFLPKGCWLGDLTRSKPQVKGSVLSFIMVVGEEVRATSTVMLTNADDEVVDRVKSHDSVHEVKVVSCYRGSVVLKVKHDCPLAEAFVNSSPPPTPFVVREGRGEWAGKDEPEYREMREELSKRGVKVIARHVRRRDLTLRQRIIFLRAIQEGYYDYPRRITLSELAEKLGVSKSYLSETLMKVESRLLKEAARSLLVDS